MLDVSGTVVQVLFDVDVGGSGAGVRWIPYCNFFNNDFYCMPDIGDTVFCYYENEGSAICLGSKHINNTRDDFSYPWEKMMTANNRMIRFKSRSVEFNANRKEYDGEDDQPVKIVLSEDTGIEISSEKDINIISDHNILIQSNDLDTVKENPIEWFESSRKKNMQQFDQDQQKGENKYISDGGSSSCNAGWEMVKILGGNLISGFANDITEPFQLISTLGDMFGSSKKEDTPDKPPVSPEEVDTYKVDLFAVENCTLALENGPSVRFLGNGTVEISSPKFRWLGLEKGSGYAVQSASQSTFMDTILDGVQLVLDIVGCIPVCSAVCGAANAGISLIRGDYYGALTSVVGMFCPGAGLIARGLDKLGDASKTAKSLISALEILKSGAVAFNAFLVGNQQFSELMDLIQSGEFDVSNPDHWNLLISAVGSYFSGFSSMRDTSDAYKELRSANSNKPSANSQQPDNHSNPTEQDGHPQNGNASTIEGQNETNCGDPIDAITGSQKIVQTEFIIHDLTGDFPVQRSYESIYTNAGGLLGSRWFLNIGSWIYIDGQNASIMMPDMHLEKFTFHPEQQQWVNCRGADLSLSLEQLRDGYSLTAIKEKKVYRYDVKGRLVSIADFNGNRIWLRYVGDTLTQMEFPSGQSLSFTYNANKIASIRDTLGRTLRYTYDQELLTCVEYNNGGQIHYVYTPEGYLAQITDQNGHTYLKDEYDSLGRVTRQMLSNGQEYVLFYDDANRCNTFLDTITGYRTFYYYNSANLTVKTCFEDGSEERYAYDEKQNKILISDRRGHEMHQRFNEQSLLVYQELPNGLITQFTYDAMGNMSRQWDNAGRDKTYQYDQNGNLVQFTNTIDESSCQTTKITYDSKGRITAVRTPGGGEWVYSYDGDFPYPDLITSPNETCVYYNYDQAGRCMSIITDQGRTSYAYNDWDRCCQITDPLEHTTKYLFDLLCNLIKVIRPNQYNPSLGDGPGTRYIYDEMDEQVLRIDALGNVWATLRDAAENVVKEIHPNTYDFQTNDGEGIRSEYDSNDNKIRIIYPDQSIERIFYDPMGSILKKVQPMDYDAKRDDGVGYTYEYDEVNRLVQITAPDGTVEKRYVYDLCGNIVKLIDAVGYLTGKTDAERIGSLYTYNYAGWLTEERKPCQYGADGQPQYQLTQYKYDVAGNCIEERRYLHFQTETSMSGPLHVIRFEYDKADRLVKVSDQTGAAVEYTYDLQNRRIKERRRLRPGVNQLFRWKYDAGGRLIEQGHMVERADGGTAWASVLYDYDKTGNIVHIQMPAGGEVFREYDAIDRLTAETHVDKVAGIHNRTEFAYDKAGNLVEITDNQGHKTKIEYDLLNHEIRRTAPDGGVTRSFYNGNGLLAKQVRPNQYDPKADNGEGYQYTYDHKGNIVSVVGPDGHVLQTNVYDGDGRLLQQLDAVQSGASFTYDLAGNRVHIETTGGATQQLEYDAHGNIVGVVDGNHNRTRYRLDEWGRIIGILKPDESTESYTYDFAGNMTSSTDGEGHTTQYEYNVAGQVRAIVDPTGERETYLYDGEDRLISRTDRNGVTVEMGYNLYGAPLFQKAKDGSPGNFYEYTPDGLLKCAISDGMRYAYEYDEMDRLVRKSASGRTLLSMAYDQNGNKVKQIDVTGKVTEYSYSILDLPEKIWDDGNELAAYEYNADGTIRQEQHGPVLKQYHYDQDKNLTGLFVQSGNAILANNRYLYDGNGNRTHKKQLGDETLYHYDPLNQLQKVQYPGYTEELFYDKAGNRTRRIAQGVEEFYQYDPRNRLTAYTKNGTTTLFRYDHAGNLLADDKARYSYDAFNRTTRVETFDGNIQVNRYDAEGLRHEMEENGSLVKFIFNPDREAVVEESRSSLTRYIRSSELIARNTDAARTYYHYVSDEMGSTTHIVDEDGIVFNHYDYDAWGNLTAQEEAVPNRFKFTGQQLDSVTQQYYLRARFYNPVIARFTQEDTYRGDGLNLYAYCQNNPVFYTDPSGNVCPEGTKDPLLHAPVPSPNQQQSTALVPYDPEFAAKQNALHGNGYANANQSPPNLTADTLSLNANSQANQPVKPNVETLENGQNSAKQFKNSSLLDNHYQRHGSEIGNLLEIPNYSINQYLDDANYIITNGTYVPELNGYVKFMRGPKYGFVGLDRSTGDITTFHIKDVTELIKKAPSLGFGK